MFTGHDYAGADEYLVLDVYRDAVFVPSNNGLAFYLRVTEGTLHNNTPLVRSSYLA